MTELAIDVAAEEEATLASLAQSAAERVWAESKTGVARSAEIAEAISQNDIDELMELQEKMVGIIDQILANTIDPEELGLIAENKLYDLAREHLDRKDVERLLEVRHKVVRAAIFAHITETNRKAGAADPEHTPGEAPVPALGRKFAREGGRMKAVLNHAELKKRLGTDRWEQVCKAEIVPAVPEHIEHHLDEDALLALVRKDPSVMEIFRDCVTAGGYGIPRMTLKEIK